MALETTNYQCLACGGPLRFDGATQKLVCDHCDSAFDVATVEAEYAARQAKADAAAAQAGATGGVATDQAASEATVTDDGLVQYICSSCGAELVSDGTTAVTKCPYCDNPTVVPGVLQDAFKPDLVIPFKLDHDRATQALSDFYKGKKFLPKEFSSNNRIQEIQGVYVPFWLYDARANGQGYYEGRQVRTYTQGDERITETKYFDCSRAGTLDFVRVPVDGSSKMPDTHMDAIEPFDYSELVPYSVAYLPGYLADRYDQDCTACSHRAENRMVESMKATLEDTVTGYDSVSCKSCDVGVDWGKSQYAMFPVWLLNTKWNGEDFLFAMNGQTGKLVGNLPVSMAKVITWFVGILVLVGAIAAAAIFGLGMMEEASTAAQIGAAVGVGAVVAAIACFIFYSQMKTANEATQAQAYRQLETFNLTCRDDVYMRTSRKVEKIEKNKK